MTKSLPAFALTLIMLGCQSDSKPTLVDSTEAKPREMTTEEAGALTAELIERRERDQAVRSLDFESMSDEERMAAFENFRSVDEDNTAWLKEVVDTWGWPPMSMIGREASIGAF
ncbi:MAG: hypothetical protein O7G85_14050, partial [Planctomycetota bacterium]|nr:hypothetical protein [Planctomycetota bacterium]